jgi:hypothetical protein
VSDAAGSDPGRGIEDVEQVKLDLEDIRFVVQPDPAVIHYEIEGVAS